MAVPAAPAAAPAHPSPPPGYIPYDELVIGKIYKSYYIVYGYWKFVKYLGLFGRSQNMLRFTAFKDDNSEYPIVVHKNHIRVYPITKSLDEIPFRYGIPNLEELMAQLSADAWERRGAAVTAKALAANNNDNNSRRRKRTTRKTRRRRSRSNLN